MKSNPQVSLLNINGTEIIHAPRKGGWSWHAEHRSLSGGSKLIEQTLNMARGTEVHDSKLIEQTLLLIRQCLKFVDKSDFLLLVWREMLRDGTIAYPCEQDPKLVR